MLLQIEVMATPDQQILTSSLLTPPVAHFERVTAEGGLGERAWLRADGYFQCDYATRVRINRSHENVTGLAAVAPHLLPGDTVRYLMPSRYCPADQFQSFVTAEFGALEGGARIMAMCDWISTAFAYVPGSSNAQTTALDTFVQREGVCRDFAHVLITLARASTIPARFASVYAPDVTPQDFHAVAEVYLQGGWHLVDPTGMASAETIARIGVGMDAAEVAFLNAFGRVELIRQTVSVVEVQE